MFVGKFSRSPHASHPSTRMQCPFAAFMTSPQWSTQAHDHRSSNARLQSNPRLCRTRPWVDPLMTETHICGLSRLPCPPKSLDSSLAERSILINDQTYACCRFVSLSALVSMITIHRRSACLHRVVYSLLDCASRIDNRDAPLSTRL